MISYLPSFFLSVVFNSHELGTGVFISILVSLVLLMFSAMVSGSEIAFFSLSPATLRQLKDSDNAGDKLVVSLLENPKRLLANIIIINNFVNVALIVLLSYLLSKLFFIGDSKIWIFLFEVVIITILILLFGEIMPKVLATHKSLAFARFMSAPLNFASVLIYPLSSILLSSTSFIDRRIERKSYNISMDEFSHAIDLTMSGSGETGQESEKVLLKGIAKFGDTEAREVMRSRVDITAVEAETEFSKLLKIIHESGYSRIPVYKDNFDNIAGILYIKDLLPYIEQADYNWNKLIRPAYFIPESKKISDLLKDFQKRKIHMAIVVDEYGGTSGIITLEDVIEEIVGDINDEFDMEADEFVYSQIDENIYLFDAKTSILDFCRITGFAESELEDERREAETLAGLVLESYGRIPGSNEEVIIGKLIIKIESSDNRRIKRIKVTINKKDEKK